MGLKRKKGSALSEDYDMGFAPISRVLNVGLRKRNDRKGVCARCILTNGGIVANVRQRVGLLWSYWSCKSACWSGLLKNKFLGTWERRTSRGFWLWTVFATDFNHPIAKSRKATL